MTVDTLYNIEEILSLLPYGLMFFIGLCVIKLAVDEYHKGT